MRNTGLVDGVGWGLLTEKSEKKVKSDSLFKKQGFKVIVFLQ